MSLLQTIDPARLGTPVRAKAAPDRLIAGDPDFLTWALDSSRDGEVRTGIWEATPGETLSVKGESGNAHLNDRHEAQTGTPSCS
jgi:hypothetical protein